MRLPGDAEILVWFFNPLPVVIEKAVLKLHSFWAVSAIIMVKMSFWSVLEALQPNKFFSKKSVLKLVNDTVYDTNKA